MFVQIAHNVHFRKYAHKNHATEVWFYERVKMDFCLS